MHTPVFLVEAVQSLEVVQNGQYIDATFGEGGHSRKIVSSGGRVLGIDADKNQVAKHQEGIIKVIHGNFADIERIAQENDFIPVDGILFDFGLSMEQLSKSQKGFSYRKLDEPLDMRIGDTDLTAAEFLQKTEPHELIEMIMKYSEDIQAQAIAKDITIQRGQRRLETVGDLLSIIDMTLEKKHIGKKEQIYARIFQALRIIVNDEFGAIHKALEDGLKIIKPQGKMVIITFHSLEDRIVKLFAREHASELEEERVKVEKTRRLAPFERSAQLRVFTKLV